MPRPSGTRPRPTLVQIRCLDWLAAGSGLASYGDELEDVLAGKVSGWHQEIWPDARSVLALADTVEPVRAWELEPKYVRDDVAN